ncbi:RagB/SusD family nutrient uptake outer membrane protein [Dinghuibacter silviterrae]|uniref:Putative outer membrane starch-binding protein n=1 Tax=Dinghuibacter silviterrae TaxID=1539049 RepID=A0A4R8DTE1_9BACT|nr:RagB/SusD family nutrient uptake outer membrane protein [Dinghuibacter silviterrae]TDX01379.1 putative outer membrane starch-binding protein [Dinghuibacter silviterrae]
MKKYLLYIVLLVCFAAPISCKKILNKVDFNGVPNAEVWSSASTANLYLNGLYNIIMPYWPCDWGNSTLPIAMHNTSDDQNGGNTSILQGTLTVDQVTDFYTSNTNSVYPYIRRINILFANIDNYGLDSNTTAPIKAQAYFLRAFAYFQLVKLYGGVPYITKPQDWITDSLNVYRNSTSQCVDSMLADLNHCTVLPSSWTGADFGRITSVAALALKARILLYWASPQFNPTGDMTRWQQAYTANEAAYDSLVNAGYGLYTNFSRIALDAISTTSDREPILFRSFNGSNVAGLYNGYDNVTRPYSQGTGSGGTTNNPTWNLVTAFPMADGEPITASSAKYPYNQQFYWQNRDPRFYATIVYNGAVWGLSGTAGRKQWMYPNMTDDKGHITSTGFYCRKNIDTTVQAAVANLGKTTWVELRMGEVMLNLAECANMVGNQSEAITLLTAIRKRAGIVAGTNYGIPSGLTAAQMETFILNERRVELAFEGKRYDDLRRTRTFDQLNGSYRDQLVITLKKGVTVSLLETLNTLTNTRLRDTIDVNYDTAYFSYNVAPITNDLPINFLTTYYAYGIPSSDIGKDLNLQQTLGWTYGGAAGTFDPTK